MGFTLLVTPHGPPGKQTLNYWDSHLYLHGQDWLQKLKDIVPGVEIRLCESDKEAKRFIGEADAVYGDVGPELFCKAKRLRWIACPAAGPYAGYYHKALIESDVEVTNFRGIFGDHISAHIMSFVLAHARGLHHYLSLQRERKWQPGYKTIHLPEAKVLIVGLGGIGLEVAKLCHAFGMTVISVDARRLDAPSQVTELYRPEALEQVLPKSDFVIVTVPETPVTQNMFTTREFRLMKPSSFFINIGRGATVVLDDLAVAVQSGEIAGAGLDVFQIEPLPADHPLWNTPGVMITPHVASNGPHLNDRRTEIFLDNCMRFERGLPLRNVVDKAMWF